MLEWKFLTDAEWSIRENEIEQAVYQAAVKVFERMEAAGEATGNGHHAAQRVARDAVEELRRRRPRRG